MILGARLSGSGKWWDPNRFALAERFTVYTFDQRGTGRSSKIPVASIEQMAANLVAVMDHASLESAHYAGHSTGGGIGVATVLDFPGRLRSLLICCSTTGGDPYRQKLLVCAGGYTSNSAGGLRPVPHAAAVSPLLDQRTPSGIGRRRST